jgi:hypothetical protein
MAAQPAESTSEAATAATDSPGVIKLQPAHFIENVAAYVGGECDE